MTNDSSGDLVQIVYASAALVPFSDQDLESLLERARENNASLDVTGVLLFKDETFFQVLEGDEAVVAALFNKIECDDRHGNVLLLAKRPIDQRNFGQWNMGFVRDQNVVEQLPGFVDFFSGPSVENTFIDLLGDKQRISQILDGFRRGRWRRPATERVT